MKGLASIDCIHGLHSSELGYWESAKVPGLEAFCGYAICHIED